MKKSLFVASLLLGSFAAPTFAEESNGFYLSIGGGFTNIHQVEGDTTISGTKYDLEADIENVFGYEFEFGKEIDNWRIGISYAASEPKQEKITASTGGVGASASISPKPTYDVSTIMFNVYRDFPREGKFTPYVGVGLGSTSVELQTYTTTVAGTDITVTDDGRDLFSWDLKAGVTYDVNETTGIYGELIYHQTDSFDEDGINYDGIKSTNLLAGIKYNF
jgi:opacity protein-like surface antigen